MHKQNESETLIIKSKNGYVSMIALIMCCILGFFVILMNEKASICFSSIFCMILLLIALRYWIATGRTLIMDKNGCRVSFLWYKKAYSWNELTKYTETYENIISYRFLHDGGYIFSTKPINKPKWMGPIEYCAIVHPFAVFFVCCTPPELTKAHKQYALIYPVDKEELTACFLKWEVDFKVRQSEDGSLIDNG